MFVASMIDLDAWDSAIWRGAGFILEHFSLPTLFLPFVNEKYAIKIFEDWIATVGKDDKNENIRIALIEGDVPGESAGYYVVIGTNIDEAAKRAEASGVSTDELMILDVSRIIRANPNDGFKAFNCFKEAYFKYGEYMLMPAVLNEQTGQIRLLPKYGIHKKKLIYRHISDITENDQDAILLQKDKPYKPYKSQ